MRGLDDRLQLLLGEGRLLGAPGPPAVVRVYLDPVGAAAGLLARGAHHLGDTRGLLGPLWSTAHVRAQPARRGPVAGRGDDRPRRDKQARTRDEAVLDRPLERHVGVVGALGTEVAQGREPGEQRRTCLHARAQRAVGDRLPEHLIVPERLVVRVQEQVRVQVHQSRQQRRPGQLDDLGPGGRVHAGRGPRGTDARTLDEHHPVSVRRLARAPHLRRTQQERRGDGAAGGGEEEQHGEAAHVRHGGSRPSAGTKVRSLTRRGGPCRAQPSAPAGRGRLRNPSGRSCRSSRSPGWRGRRR